MALAVANSGTTAALTIGTETDLATFTPGSPTAYVLRVDGNALATGESLDVIAYTKTLTAGTERQEAAWRITGGDPLLMLLSHVFPIDISLRFTVTQKNGTGRTFPWKVYSL